MSLIRCSKCVNLSSRPRIEFEGNVCNACKYAEERSKITEKEWEERSREFQELCNVYKKTDGTFDCIVCASGGKDSMVVAHAMKYKYGMHPLIATFAPTHFTEAGAKNLEALRNAGLDNLVFHPNPVVMAKLCKEMFVRFGDPFIGWINGIYSYPLQLAKAYNISLVVYAEQGEAFYGGSTTVSDKKLDVGLIEKIAKTGDAKDWKQPENWIEFGFSKQELMPYIIPRDISSLEPVYYAYYHKWGPLYNLEQARKIGFTPMQSRLLGTYQGYSSIDDTIDNLYMFLMYEKFGFARCTKDCCKEIREGKMTREKAMEFVKMYDGEFPYDKKGFKEICKYLGMRSDDVWFNLKKFINPEVWKKEGENLWVNDEGAKLSLPMWK